MRALIRGFTLIELVVVTVILAIIAVIVGGPTMSHISDIRASAAAARLASDIRYVQRLALSSGRQAWVDFNQSQDRYELFIEDPANPGWGDRQPLPHPLDQSTGPVQFGVGAYQNIDIINVNVNGTARLEFDSFGVPYDANSNALTAAAQISLTGSIDVLVHPVGGFVEVTP